MARTTVRLTGMLLAVCSAVALSACSSGGGNAPDVAGGEGSVKPQDDGAIRQAWVRCMQDEGQTEVQLGEDGRIQMPMGQTEEGAGAGAGSDPLAKAMETCNKKVPGLKQLQDSAIPPEIVEEARGLVTCLRENGLTVKQVPDPDPKYKGNVAIAPDVDDKVFQKAYAICSKDYPNVGVTSTVLPDGQ
ncbi:hypothetical protein ACIQNG_05145 [Streptomyces sp. NPDC091377]|uniref:hypothetical protein n=1 Tax=Streptomyces sp. NPDC091377 TaxID=3365995 RepID=UPI003824F803